MRGHVLRLASLAALILVSGCGGYGPPAGVKARILFLSERPGVAAVGLMDPDPAVRRRSILDLARTGDYEATHAIMSLLKPNVEHDPVVRATAAVGLRILGDPRSLSALVEALRDSDPLVRREAARAVGAIGGEVEIPALSRVLMRDPDPDVRLEAAIAVGRIGGERAIKVLIRTLDDPDPSVSFAAHRGLIEITGKDLPPVPGAWRKWTARSEN